MTGCLPELLTSACLSARHIVDVQWISMEWMSESCYWVFSRYAFENKVTGSRLPFDCIDQSRKSMIALILKVVEEFRTKFQGEKKWARRKFHCHLCTLIPPWPHHGYPGWLYIWPSSLDFYHIIISGYWASPVFVYLWVEIWRKGRFICTMLGFLEQLIFASSALSEVMDPHC